jgi:hypothetical protein
LKGVGYDYSCRSGIPEILFYKHVGYRFRVFIRLFIPYPLQRGTACNTRINEKIEKNALIQPPESLNVRDAAGKSKRECGSTANSKRSTPLFRGCFTVNSPETERNKFNKIGTIHLGSPAS